MKVKEVSIPDNELEKNSTNKTLIEARNVDVFYGGFQALKNVNIAMKENSVTAFIGPSGCGKSTFLRCFNRMNDYIEEFSIKGEILIDAKKIYWKNVVVEELRKEIGMVFQKPNHFPKSIFDNVADGLKIQGIKDKTFIITE